MLLNFEKWRDFPVEILKGYAERVAEKLKIIIRSENINSVVFIKWPSRFRVRRWFKNEIKTKNNQVNKKSFLFSFWIKIL